MPTWGELIREINAVDPATLVASTSALDFVRRKYLALAAHHTGRATILYATKWTQPTAGPAADSALLMINNEDVHGFMESVHGLTADRLDLILHSPGGSAEAAEAVVYYLRSQFNHIRVIVPHMAMSAATMIACAADEIVMGPHSFLGPIDPQLTLNTSLGVRTVAAQAIIEQFERAIVECQDPAKVRAWYPMLAQYGPDLLVKCQNATELGKQLVKEWLTKYMFCADDDGATKASEIAEWLSDHENFKSHGRAIPRDDLRTKRLKLTWLEDDPKSQELFISVYHAVSLTFAKTPAVKIIENHEGRAFVKTVQQILVEQPPQRLPGAPAAPQTGRPPLARKPKRRGGRR